VRIEIEITEKMVGDALTRYVRKAISGWSFGAQVEQAISEAMKSELDSAIKAEVRRLLGDSETIKLKAEKAVNAAIKRAIK